MKKQLQVFILWLLSYAAYSQEVNIKLGNNNIALNEYFTITITINNEQIKNYSNFPDIAGFQKRGTSSSSSTNIVNGQISFSQSIIQNYAPTKEGKFKLPNFNAEVNGKKIQVQGTTIHVGPPKEQQEYDDPFGRDPFADFFGRGGGSAKEYIDVKDEAFFALTTSKDKVYVGEGFTVTLAFYVAQSNKAKMQFYDLSNQMSAIIKKIKPANCWEENFGIEEIQPQEIVIDGKKFTEYKLYRATLYPLNTNKIVFPELNLKMIKYKVAKVQSFFGINNEKQDFKDFVSKSKTVTVKELPPHPLKDNVSVGVFKLEENVANRNFKTGKTINYNFKIVGEGNISSIKNPQHNENPNFDIYPPNIYQDISRSGQAVTGAKTFNYFIIPKEPGKYKMNDLLYWVYFNTEKSKYDTLKSKLNFEVTGESSRNLAVANSDFNDFSEVMDSYNNNFINTEKDEYFKWLANILLALMLVVTFGVMIKR